MSKVLVVEDEAHIRQFVVVNLQARGYTVLQAQTAEDGLQKLRDYSPELLILDIKLPGMNGWKMLNVMDQESSFNRIPVIIMTASSSISHPDEYHYSNIVKRLNKPVSLDDLLHALTKAYV